jgi:hypothetical protein
MSYSSSNSLYMCFWLKVEHEFYSEQAIGVNLGELKEAVIGGKIDLHTTEGALSIRYKNEELLGLAFWDEINLALSSIVGQLPSLLDGQTVSEFLPLQSNWIRLTRDQDLVLYELEPCNELRKFQKKRLIPLNLFVCEIEYAFWRMTRILAVLGSRSSNDALSQWRTIIPLSIQSIISLDRIKYIVEQPVVDVLHDTGCSDS